jgi:predicted dehydrogenase
MEIFGQDGYLRLLGRDGHYGSPRITWARRKLDHSRPEEHHLEFEQGEDWRQEWQEFVGAIEEKREPLGSGSDGLRAQQMIEAVYDSAQSGRWVGIRSNQKG